MRIRLVLCTVGLLVLLATGGAIATAQAAPAEPHASSASLTPDFEAVDADEVRYEIDLQADGDAAWTIEFWIRLDDDERTEAFESVADEIESDPDGFTADFAERIDGTVDTASTATGREMSATDFSVTTERQSLAREYGVVRYSFEWRGFADTENGDIVAGDAIEGLYLEDGTRLLMSWPEGYERTAVSPEPDDERERAVIWRGSQTDFVSGEPRLVVSPVEAGLSRGLLVGIGLLGLLGVLGGAGLWWLRKHSKKPAESPNADGTTVSRAETTAESEPAAAPADDSLLSNEEQVLQLLEEHDGRMKQQAVVQTLGWTDAKTSKVVSRLREEGAVESFRIGRENVLRLPEGSEE